MNMLEYNLSLDDINEFTKITAGYQSFILNESTISICRSMWPPNIPEFNLFYERKQKSYNGVVNSSHGHKNAGSHMVLKKSEVSEDEWKYYVNHNLKFINMTQDLLTLIQKFISNISDSTILDVGCNDGSLLFSALKRGFKSGVGFDLKDHTNCFNFLKKITNLDGTFIQNKYDMYSHRFETTTQADFTICSAVLPHISDPVYFLDTISKMTNKLLLLTGGISLEQGKKIIYEGKPNNYGGTFPAGFTHANKITVELLKYSLTECGFKQIYMVEHETTWPDKYWYTEQGNCAIIAVK